MTGNEFAKQIRATKGKISVETIMDRDRAAWLYVEKQDLIRWALSEGDNQVHCTLESDDRGGHYITSC